MGFITAKEAYSQTTEVIKQSANKIADLLNKVRDILSNNIAEAISKGQYIITIDILESDFSIDELEGLNEEGISFILNDEIVPELTSLGYEVQYKFYFSSRSIMGTNQWEARFTIRWNRFSEGNNE